MSEGPVVLPLRADNVTKSVSIGRKGAPTFILKRADFTAERGEMVAIVGPSGSGKSTLLHCLAGLETVTSGSVEVLGRDLGSMTRNRLARFRRDHIGFVFQQYNLIPTLDARANVALPARLAGTRVGREAIDSALKSVGMQERARSLPAQLSGGEQQRIALARVLASAPSVVFADEPTGALDTGNAALVLAHLRDLATDGRTVVLVTHDLEAAAKADRVVVMMDGATDRTLMDAKPSEILDAIESARISADAVRP